MKDRYDENGNDKPSSLTRCFTGTTEPPTQEYTLRAMATNYVGGHSWDHLDGEACTKAADEIARLRAGDGYRAAWLELIDLCNRLKEENFQLRHMPQPVTAAQAAVGCGDPSCKDPNCQYDKEDDAYERANTAPVAWIAFAGNGNIRLWTSDESRAAEEKRGGLDLRAFTLAELVALIAKLPVWQDIETAPIDGTHVLVIDEGIVSEAYFHVDEKSWWLAQTAPGDFDPSRAIYPTLWQPKPTPPSAVSSTNSGDAT